MFLDKKHVVSRKKHFVSPQKAFVSPKKFFASQKKFFVAQKIFLYPKKNFCIRAGSTGWLEREAAGNLERTSSHFGSRDVRSHKTNVWWS